MNGMNEIMKSGTVTLALATVTLLHMRCVHGECAAVTATQSNAAYGIVGALPTLHHSVIFIYCLE